MVVHFPLNNNNVVYFRLTASQITHREKERKLKNSIKYADQNAKISKIFYLINNQKIIIKTTTTTTTMSEIFVYCKLAFGLMMIMLVNEMECFNFDLNWSVYKTLSTKSTDVYFGYSIAQHMVKSTRTPL